MADLWTNLDKGTTFGDGSVLRYHKVDPNASGDHAILYFSGFDGSILSYDVTASLFTENFPDGGVVKYDASGHAYSISLPNGATFQVTLNGSTIAVDSSGNVTVNGGSNTVTIDSGVINIDGGTININTDIVLAGG